MANFVDDRPTTCADCGKSQRVKLASSAYTCTKCCSGMRTFACSCGTTKDVWGFKAHTRQYRYTCDCGQVHAGSLSRDIPPLPLRRKDALWRDLRLHTGTILKGGVVIAVLYAFIVLTGADKAFDDERPCAKSYYEADPYLKATETKDEYCDIFNRSVSVFRNN